MDSQPARTTGDASAPDRGSSTGLNALIGAVAGIVLSFVPLSPLLGGALAGYLEDGTYREGAIVGLVAGLIMLVPFVLFGLFVTSLFLGFGPSGSGLVFGVFGLFVLTTSAAYTVGLGAVGGYIGVYLRDEL
ncbi:DUF5518 domain-containing protein [Halovivax limisalsi]|uniref:DUF5518 domain-containing protein n=1 Tax=Halovivax limisalsi TaxID=1453760 RepID=UPI001FFC2D4F|nr:DUF5518 domain-containing protein [Halovivax limisalsi]